MYVKRKPSNIKTGGVKKYLNGAEYIPFKTGNNLSHIFEVYSVYFNNKRQRTQGITRNNHRFRVKRGWRVFSSRITKTKPTRPIKNLNAIQEFKFKNAMKFLTENKERFEESEIYTFFPWFNHQGNDVAIDLSLIHI